MIGASVVSFYDPEEENGYLANFSNHGFYLEGRYWKSVEHYFQANKFIHRDDLRDKIARSCSPADAKMIAANLSRLRRPDWYSVREEVMYKAMTAKFEQHPCLRKRLLGTDEMAIEEASPIDTFWGVGADGSGENHAGQLLMRLRAELRARPLGREQGC